MKFEGEHVTNETSLIAALAARGRIASANDIATWRKNGLLPPLVGHGLGPGKGKFHCWHDRHIVARAVTVFDAIKKHGRTEHAVVMLFLSGFEVPLPKFRRAWASRLKLRRTPAIKQAGPIDRPAVLDPQALLLQPILALSAALRPDENSTFVTRCVEHGLARLGYGRRCDAGQLCSLLTIVAMTLDTSDVVHKADAAELQSAQRYLEIALRFLDGGSDRRGRLMEAIGPSLFVFILAMVHSGQGTALEDAVAQVEQMGQPVSVRPAHPTHAPIHAANAAG